MGGPRSKLMHPKEGIAMLSAIGLYIMVDLHCKLIKNAC